MCAGSRGVGARNSRSGGRSFFLRDLQPRRPSNSQKNCQSCHRPGQVPPCPLINYKDTRPWAKAIKSRRILRKCPLVSPTRSMGISSTTDRKSSEIDTLASGLTREFWKAMPRMLRRDRLAQGAGKSNGNRMDLPPHEVPAKGVLEWELIALPAPFKSDTCSPLWKSCRAKRRAPSHLLQLL